VFAGARLIVGALVIAYGLLPVLSFDEAATWVAPDKETGVLVGRLVREGVEHLAEGRFDQAEAVFGRVTDLAPDFAAAHCNHGAALAHLGRHVDAVAAYRRALDPASASVVARTNLASALRELGRIEEALLEAEEAVRLNPRFAPARVVLALLSGDLELHDRAEVLYRRFGDAVAACEVAARIDSTDAGTLFMLGTAYWSVDRLADAATAFESVARLAPRQADAHFNLGAVYDALGRYEDAVAAYDQALRVDPEHAEARLQRALTFLVNLDDREAALRDYDVLLMHDPERAERLARYLDR